MNLVFPVLQNLFEEIDVNHDGSLDKSDILNVADNLDVPAEARTNEKPRSAYRRMSSANLASTLRALMSPSSPRSRAGSSDQSEADAERLEQPRRQSTQRF